MSKQRKPRETVYAVVRLDLFHGDQTPLEDVITIKEVFREVETAESEVQRLNELNAEKDVRYFWQGTRLFPAAGDRAPG